MYLFIQLFIYISMDSQIFVLFYELVSNAIIILLLKLFQFWRLETPSSWLLCPFRKFLIPPPFLLSIFLFSLLQGTMVPFIE